MQIEPIARIDTIRQRYKPDYQAGNKVVRCPKCKCVKVHGRWLRLSFDVYARAYHKRYRVIPTLTDEICTDCRDNIHDSLFEAMLDKTTINLLARG